MQINARELSGIFQIDRHTSSTRLLWIVCVVIALITVAYGAWMAKANVIVFSENVTLKFLELALAFFFILIAPAGVIILGLIKSLKKPGIYLKGVRVASEGIETGTLILDETTLPDKKILVNEIIDSDTSGKWVLKNKWCKDTINILFVLWQRDELPKSFSVDRIIFSSQGLLLFKIFANDIYLTQRNNIVALSQGSLHSLGNDDSIYPDDVDIFQKKIADIVSGWEQSFALSCTLKVIPGQIPPDSVLAIGVLGSFNTKNGEQFNNRETQITIFDSLNS